MTGSWDACADEAGCRKLVHLFVSADELNAMPLEWVLSALDDCRFDSEGFRWVNSEGFPHRTNGPAVERSDGTVEWRVNGELHRDGGPAIEGFKGWKMWYRHGELHREDGAAVIHANGFRQVWVDGNFVREDGYFDGKIIKRDESYYMHQSSIPKKEEAYVHELSEYF